MRFHELPLPLLFVVHASASLDGRAISYQSLTSMYDSSNGSSRDDVHATTSTVVGCRLITGDRTKKFAGD